MDGDGKRNTIYERDFHAWTNEQATLLRAGCLSDIDVAHVAEEIEALGRSERRELVNRLSVLLLHLLKWSYQPDLRGRSWELTVKEQRRQLARHLKNNPSLGSWTDEAMADAYGDAVLRAELEMNLLRDMLPWSCPYRFEQAMDEAFWPDPA
jgi:hypothetical protein